MNWDISQERAYVENLVNQRFNFLLVFATIVAGGAVATGENAIVQFFILSSGTYFCHHIAETIYRAQLKLDTIFGLLRKDENHPYTLTSKLADAKRVKGAAGKSQLQKIGRLIPERIVQLLLALCFLSALNVGIKTCDCLVFSEASPKVQAPGKTTPASSP
jgi:hypothetical protein